MKTLQKILMPILILSQLPLASRAEEDTSKLSELATKIGTKAAETAERLANKTRASVKVNFDEIRKDIAVLEQLNKDTLKAMQSAKPQEKRKLQEMLLEKKKDVLEDLIEFQADFSGELTKIADDFQLSLGGFSDASKMTDRHKAVVLELDGLQKDGRSLILEFQKFKEELAQMDRASAEYRGLVKNMNKIRNELTKKAVVLQGTKRMVDLLERRKQHLSNNSENVIKWQEYLDNVVSKMDANRLFLSGELEFVKEQLNDARMKMTLDNLVAFSKELDELYTVGSGLPKIGMDFGSGDTGLSAAPPTVTPIFSDEELFKLFD